MEISGTELELTPMNIIKAANNAIPDNGGEFGRAEVIEII